MGKYIRLNKDGLCVLFCAKQEAERWETDFVAPEHLLLSLLRDPSYLACRALTGLGVDTEELRRQTEERLVAGPGRREPRVRLTEQSIRIADLWPEEAVRLRSDEIGTEHQFLGLIRRAEGSLAEVFERQGIREDAFRAQAIAIQQGT